MTYYSHKSYYSYDKYSKYGSYNHSSYTTYEITAFTGNDLFSGGKAQCGLTFDMAAVASTCISVSDDDSKLSGDCRDNATDCTGQKAGITDADGNEMGNGGQIYAEKYFWVTDENGFKYVLIEIEQEGSGAKFYTFHSAYGIPPEGAELTVGSSCNVSSEWIKYDDLGAGPCELPTGSISGTAWCDLDCDGIQDEEVTYTKGDPIFTHSVTYESVTCTKYNVDCYGDWYSTGCDTIDLVVGADEGHKGNAHDNTIVELDKGGVWSRDFCVDAGGTYCLTFDTYKNFCVDDAGNKFDVKINGHVVETVTVSADGSIELSVDLNAGYNEIEFVSKSCYGGSGAGIDNVNFAPLIETSAPSEPTKAGLTVKLLYTDGSPVLDDNGVAITTVTDADGNYRFDDVPVGDYKIMGIAPDGTEFTIQDAGSDDSVDSDVNSDGMSGVVTVVADQDVDVDLGLCEKPEPGSLSGRYFCDVNRDGIDNDEPGEAGVTVVLLDANGNPATDIDGNPVATVLTAADGSYSFGNLAAGTYKVQFVDTVTGKVLTAKDVGSDDTVDSDADDLGGNVYEIADIIVVAGQETADNDAGVMAQPGSLSGRFFVDEDRNGIDDGEPGVEGITVVLLDASGNPATDIDGNPVASTLTAADGSYSFGNLGAGTYKVQFINTETGTVLTDKDVGSDDTVDSDADDLGGNVYEIADIAVVAGQETADNDAGIKAQPGSLSGRFFVDEDRNGVDDGEPGVEGITVVLLDASGNPATDIDGNPVASTLTAADGSYSFGNLGAGTYKVQFVNTVTGTVLTDKDVGSDDTVDSDADDLGGNVYEIADIAVVAGQETADNDAGIYTPNEDPTATDDMGKACADELITVDLSDNYSDADSASVAITMLDGVAIADGETKTISGLEVTRSGDEFIFNGETAYDALDIGEEATQSLVYTVEDSDGGTATASIDVTFCGTANTVESFVAAMPSEVVYEISYALDEGAPVPDYALDLTIISSDNGRLDGVTFTEAYCLDFGTAIETITSGGGSNTAAMFGSQSAEALALFDPNTVSNANGLHGSENLDLINWIIAQNYEDQGYSGWEVQLAIWELADNFDASLVNYNAFNNTQEADVDAILNAALNPANEGFEFSVGDTVGLIIDPGDSNPDNVQPFIVAVDWDPYDCLC
jgi:FlaG/FlaF family flagellin (archaellin)